MKSRPMARYTLPGSFFNEEETVELPERSVEAAVQAAPKWAFAFKLYDSPLCDFEFPADLFRLVPIPQNESHRYYIGGTLYTVEEVEAMGDDFRILASNMRGNRWPHVIKTRAGNFQPFEEGDEIVEAVVDV